MPIRTHLRRLLHVTLAVTMAAGLLHGASMDFANAATGMQHVSPHDVHAHHMGAQDGHDMAGNGSHEQSPSGDEHHSTSAMPGCPLANVAAIQPSILFEIMTVQGARIALHTLAPLLSVDPLLSDPPPRASA